MVFCSLPLCREGLWSSVAWKLRKKQLVFQVIPFGGNHLLENVSDASWCSEPGRLSISCSVIYFNRDPVFITHKWQKSVALSSCESELRGASLSLQEAIPIKNVLESLTGCVCELVHRVDSNSCREVLNRDGLGGLKHVGPAYLWCQEKEEQRLHSECNWGSILPARHRCKASGSSTLQTPVLHVRCGK